MVATHRSGCVVQLDNGHTVRATDRDLVLIISAATIDRLLGDVEVAASGGTRRRAGFCSAVRREVPIRTFNDWKSQPPGLREVDMVAHGGTSAAGSFIQTLIALLRVAESYDLLVTATCR